MPISNEKLPFEGNAILLEKLAEDYNLLSKLGNVLVPKQRHYLIKCAKEASTINRSARKAAIKALGKPLVKIAFDTRKIDQEHERNPRTNLQYWNRSQQFIDEATQGKINAFSKLLVPLKEIKEAYGAVPEYHNSYARVLIDQVERTLLIKDGTVEVFAPQMAYLEQLLYARYRLSLDDIVRMNNNDLKRKILDKDESLLKRGIYLEQTGGIVKNNNSSNNPIIIDGNSTQKNIIEAIFGNNQIRRDGEKKVSRTITINITDQVEE